MDTLFSVAGAGSVPYPEMAYPSREYRLLALFRMWTVFHYFFPYHQHLDRPWGEELIEFIPRFEAAGDAPAYHRVIRELSARTRDSHVGVWGDAVKPPFGAHFPAMAVRRVDGKAMVVAVKPPAPKDPRPVSRGDELLSVDGRTVEALMDRLAREKAFSTPQALQGTLGAILGGDKDSLATLGLRDPHGTSREVHLRRTLSADEHSTLEASAGPKRAKTRLLPEGFGYVDLVQLPPQEVGAMLETFKDTPALVVDIRGYPQGAAFTLAPRLAPRRFVGALFRRPHLTSPDPDLRFDAEFRQAFDPVLPTYAGRLAVLINEDAISQSEHSCLLIEAATGGRGADGRPGRTVFIGTPTVGANGDVTSVVLPGAVRVSFSGHDVRHADGRPLQRQGIQPDVHVEPTWAGLLAGRDEVLETAVAHLQGQLRR